MTKDFRVAALKILNEVFINRRWAKDSIDAHMADIDDGHGDIKKVYEVVYGILRNKSFIDFRLSAYFKNKPSDERLFNILRIGYYMLKFMKGIPDYAVINTCVEIAKTSVHPKTGPFINAILRGVVRDTRPEPKIPEGNKTEYFAIKYSYEKWFIDFILKNYPKDAESILKAGSQKPPVFLKVNELKGVRPEKVVEELEKEYVTAEEVKIVKGCLKVVSGDSVKTEAFEKGLFFIQDLSSQALISLIEAGAEEAIMDIGSAPGGKAAGMAISMKNKGNILAIEKKKERITLMERNFARLGITNTEVMAHDAVVDIPALNERADKLLIDAPCSAFGVIRRHPEKKWCLSEKELKEFPKLQSAMLATASRWVKKGGEIFYSTCTINPDENESVIEKFLEKNGDFKAVKAVEKDSKLKSYADKNYFRSLPGNKDDMDGFFVAKLKRK